MSETVTAPLLERTKTAFGTKQFQTAYDQLLKTRPGILASEFGGELEWLKDARERDYGRWMTEGLPTKQVEKWMYTNLAPIAESSLALPLPAKTSADFGSIHLKGQNDSEIVFVNGQYSAALSTLDPSSGVSIVVLSELFEECVNNGWSSERKAKFASFRKHVESSDADRETVFAAMNTSFMQDGILIHVAKDVQVSQPILVRFLTDVSASELTLVSPRLFVHLDAGAEASVLEVFEGHEGQRYFSNAVSDIRLEENSRLSYCKVQLESKEAFHIGTTRIQQKRSSFSESFQFSFGAKLSRQDLHISLNGEAAETSLDGLYMVNGRQHVDNHTAVEHVVPHTLSSQIYKGVLGDQARAVFNGFVRIHRDAQKSNASQLNNNLMMSPKAEIDTKPELEIDADDVKASHGATIGRIDPDHVFYLQTRAIPKSEAIRLLALGFAQDVAFRIRNASIRKRVQALVDERFEQLKVEESLVQ